jgi:hypothetical protein
MDHALFDRQNRSLDESKMSYNKGPCNGGCLIP